MVEGCVILKCLPNPRPVFPQCYNTAVFIVKANELIEAIQTNLLSDKPCPNTSSVPSGKGSVKL